jgi:nicotinic acid phosphoribosyltransferase
MNPLTSPLLTDLYQLNMIQAYLDHGETKTSQQDGLNKTARRSALDDADREKFAFAAWQWRFH